MFYADSMAFFALQAEPPILESLAVLPSLSLAHLTSVPPFIRNFEDALAMHQTFQIEALSNEMVYSVLDEGDIDFGGSWIGVLFGMQHSPENLSLPQLETLYCEGIRSMALAYSQPTMYGDGYLGQGPLTAAGAELIRNMAATGIVLDLSHAGHNTAAGALNLINKESLDLPVFASHSGSYAVYPHPRNLPDEIAQGIVGLGGYIGVPAITFMMCSEGADYLAEYVKHVLHLVSVCGNGVIGIGSDCNHIKMTMPAARRHFENMLAMLEMKEGDGVYFPDRPPQLIKYGHIMFQFFRAALEKGGCDDTQVRQICGLNFRDFLQHALMP